jgi:DNA-binding NtrC family response regulator
VPDGSVFLDEVGEMSPRMQAVLLRFLESGELQRIGRERPHATVHPRLIAATNRDLAIAIRNGSFREDLYFRLNVIPIRVPSLRERLEDVPLLVAHFLSMTAGRQRRTAPSIEPDALAALASYCWPGNIREVRNVVERLVAKVADGPITLADLPEEQRAAAPVARPAVPAAASTMPAALVSQMFDRGESFWSTVYPAFMARDLTRRDLREIIRTGLESTRGNYRMLVERFNMSRADYRRFLAFLRQHDCHLSEILRPSGGGNLSTRNG